MVIGRILKNNGYELKMVSNGELALEALANEDFDLVIIDMHMPSLGGIDTYKTYIAKNRASHIPFIMLTANATVEARKQCKDAGIEYFLTKPISSTNLIQTINLATGAITEPNPIPEDEPETKQNKNSGPIDSEILQRVITMAPNSDFLDRLHQSMDSYGKSILEDMNRARRDEDLQKFKDLAHTLKGATISLGMSELSQLLQKAELITSGKFNSQGSDYITQLTTAFQQGMLLTKKEFDSNDATPKL
jgi:two-component system sensor histidine kinase RpfC